MTAIVNVDLAGFTSGPLTMPVVAWHSIKFDPYIDFVVDTEIVLGHVLVELIDHVNEAGVLVPFSVNLLPGVTYSVTCGLFTNDPYTLGPLTDGQTVNLSTSVVPGAPVTPEQGSALSARIAALESAGGTPDATTTSKGTIKLAGDLSGTADAPTVPGLAGKATPAFVSAAVSAAIASLGSAAAAATTDFATAAQGATADTAVQPSGLTKAAVGLGSVDNTSDPAKPISTATQTALDEKTTPAYVDARFTALIGAAPGALDTLGEIATQLASDESAVNALITEVGNKVASVAAGDGTVTIGGTATNPTVQAHVGTTAGTVTAGDDGRLTDARPPTAHAATHAAGGTDPVTVTEAQVTGLDASLAAKADEVQLSTTAYPNYAPVRSIKYTLAEYQAWVVAQDPPLSSNAHACWILDNGDGTATYGGNATDDGTGTGTTIDPQPAGYASQYVYYFTWNDHGFTGTEVIGDVFAGDVSGALNYGDWNRFTSFTTPPAGAEEYLAPDDRGFWALKENPVEAEPPSVMEVISRLVGKLPVGFDYYGKPLKDTYDAKGAYQYIDDTTPPVFVPYGSFSENVYFNEYPFGLSVADVLSSLDTRVSAASSKADNAINQIAPVNAIGGFTGATSIGLDPYYFVTLILGPLDIDLYQFDSGTSGTPAKAHTTRVYVTGPGSVTFSGSISWAGGAAPTYIDATVYEFTTWNSGAKWYGQGFNSSTGAGIGGVAVTGTPTAGQVPVATSGTAATWQTPTSAPPDATTGAKGIVQLTNGLDGTATAPTVVKVQAVAVSATAPTTGQALVATSGTAAGWAAPAPAAHATTHKSGGSDAVKLNELAAPTAAVALGSQKITGLADGTASSDGAAFGQIPTALPPNGAAGGGLSGSYPNPTVAKINGVAVTGTPTTGMVPTATSGTAATWQTPSGGGVPATDVQKFLPTGAPGSGTLYTWTKPAGAKWVSVVVIGAGCGGGSGRQGAAGTVRCGGGAGSPGGVGYASFLPSDLPATVGILVAKATLGGVGQATPNSNGNGSINVFTDSSFGTGAGTTYVLATAGSAGYGGSAVSGAGGVATWGYSQGAANGNGASASTTGGVGGTINGSNLYASPMCGGAGGGITSADVPSAGGKGGTANTQGWPGAAAGAAGGGAGAAGILLGVYGMGGGGGGGSITSAGGAGGAGAAYGAGGSGGGASLNGYTSGAGGAGGDGVVIVTTYF